MTEQLGHKRDPCSYVNYRLKIKIWTQMVMNSVALNALFRLKKINLELQI